MTPTLCNCPTRRDNGHEPYCPAFRDRTAPPSREETALIINQVNTENVAGMISTLDFCPAEHHPADCLPIAKHIFALLARRAAEDVTGAVGHGITNAADDTELFTGYAVKQIVANALRDASATEGEAE